MLPTAFFHLAFVLLAIALVERILGPHGQFLTSLLAVLVLLPSFIHLALRKWSWPYYLFTVTGLVGFYLMDGPMRLFALSGAFFFATTARDDRKGKDLAALLGVVTFAYALFAVLREHVPLWGALSSLSERLSVFITTQAGSTASLGPSYSGLFLLVAFLIAFLGTAFFHRPHPIRLLAGAVVLLLALPAGLVLGAYVPHHYHGVELRAVLGWRLFSFVLLLLSLAILSFRQTPRSDEEASAPVGWRRPLSWLTATLALTGLVLLSWSTAVKPGPVRALLDARGSFNMEPLVWGKYANAASPGASLATLPPLMDAMGFELATTDTIRVEDLADRNVLVIMNPTKTYSPAEHAAIWGFVERGGGLLVLGDHTDIQGTMRPINELLEPCGLVLNFDSAIPLVDRWTWYGCMNFHPHPLTRTIRDESQVKTSVGASLTLKGRAIPLISGREAYSDPGDAMNLTGAFLGNMAHDRHERKGDLFLVAEAPYGQGKAILFGDTSPFQRSNLSYTYEFVARVFTYLSVPGSAVAPRGQRLGGALLLLAASVFLLALLPASLPALAFLSIVSTSWLLTLDLEMTVELPDPLVREKIAWVDIGHGNRVDLHANRSEGLGGLNNHLWRQGFVPLATRRCAEEDLARADIFVVMAPSFPYGNREIQDLRRFVENGGLLIVATGFEERRGAAPLLKEFGYDIGAVPIGAAHASTTALEGHHVMMHESWPVVRPEGRGEVWVECWGFPLVVFERVGHGGLIVIGDSFFLGEVKTETSETFVEVNINFLRTAIETARGEGKGGS